MLKQLTNVQVWVHDQDEALAFYTEKLGLELRDDVTVPEMGNFRWLTVGVPGQPDVAITLMAVPGPPVFDAETRDQIKALMAKGAARGSATRRATRCGWCSRSKARPTRGRRARSLRSAARGGSPAGAAMHGAPRAARRRAARGTLRRRA